MIFVTLLKKSNNKRRERPNRLILVIKPDTQCKYIVRINVHI